MSGETFSIPALPVASLKKPMAKQPSRLTINMPQGNVP
jgi:hypothetical protein